MLVYCGPKSSMRTGSNGRQKPSKNQLRPGWPHKGDSQMKKIVLSIAAIALTAFAAPAMADGYDAGGYIGGYLGAGYGAGSGAYSGASNNGTGHIEDRYNWSGSMTNNEGALTVHYDNEEGDNLVVTFDGTSQASAGAGSYIKTTGSASSNASSSAYSHIGGGLGAAGDAGYDVGSFEN